MNINPRIMCQPTNDVNSLINGLLGALMMVIRSTFYVWQPFYWCSVAEPLELHFSFAKFTQELPYTQITQFYQDNMMKVDVINLENWDICDPLSYITTSQI